MSDPTIEGFVLSPLQHHLWRECTPHGVRVNVARVRVRGTLDAGALRGAFDAVSAETEILRTAFRSLHGTKVGVQAILDEARLRFEHHDGAGAPDELERALLDTPFDVENGEVLRVLYATPPDGDATLVIAQPALAADATSLWNLVERVAARLRGESTASADDEGEGEMQFADLAQWFQDNLESEDAAPGFAHWRAIDWSAAGVPLPLAFDRGAAAGSQRGATQRAARAWSEADEAALTGVADRLGVEPASVLLAAWQLTLARHAERDTIVVGARSEGRSFEGLDVALGPFARLLPIELKLAADDAFADVAKRVDAARHAASDWHEVFDFDRAGATSRALPLAFVARDPLEGCDAIGVRFELLSRRVDAEPFRVGLVLDRAWESPELALAFDPRYFGAADAETLLAHVSTLLAAACAAPETRASALPLASADERARLLSELASGGPSTPTEALVHEVIASFATKTPDAVAVWADDRELTYAELDARANRIANHLRALGVGPGTFVGLFLDRCVEQIAAIVGVLKAGGAYLPLPPGYPDERVAFMLEDTKAPVVLTRKAVAGALPAIATDPVIVVLDDCAELDAASDAAPDSAVSGTDPAYVIFTSGSTGKPKGVPIAHANLAHSTGARLGYYPSPSEAYLLVSSFAFDSSVVGIFWTLCQGGRLVLPRDGFEQEIPAIPALVKQHGITHLLALPSLYGALLDAARQGELDSLNTVIVAGESCPPELVKRHLDALPSCGIYNEYGPTEATVWSSVFDCSTPFERPSVPIGRAIPGASTFVVKDGDLAPIGIAGELWIAGAGVAGRYLDRPELTAERFVQAEFLPGETLYRTGDLVRLLPEGNLEFLGRIDHQVKIRGYRIELEEIEATLAAHPSVKEAVVLAREDTPGDVRLVAYSTGPSKEGHDAQALREHLATTLPDYMVPAHFVFVSEFPLLPNGKVNRRELAPPDQGRAALSAPYAAPETPLQKVLAILWAGVLKHDEIGLDDDFFELGGHSILATQLFARMVDTLQVRTPLRAIFDGKTVRGLAEIMLSDDADRARLEKASELVLTVLES